VIYVDDGEHGGSITTEQFSEPNAHFRAPFQTCPLSPDILTGDIVPDILLREYDAIIYEPVQRRTGLALGYEVMERIKSLSEQIGAFVIVDESATSFARCGITGFISGAHHHADIVIASESLGQGLPLCALGHASGYEDCYKPPRGWPSISPRAAQVGLNVIETIKQGHGSELCLAQRSYNMGMLVIETFKDWNVRVTGSMIHIHVGDATRAALELRKAGILVNHFGPWIILTPHLIMSLVDFGHTLTKMLEVLDG
jgi:acetylornithine/succinyldiaminopimelate/putrescine aminotransferase